MLHAQALGYFEDESLDVDIKRCKSVLDAFPQAAGASAATCEEGWISSQQLQFSEATEGQPLLWMAPQTWEDTLATMAEYTGLDTDKSATDFFHERFDRRRGEARTARTSLAL